MDNEEAFAVLDRIPHLKLRPSDLLKVLRAIKKSEPKRVDVQAEVMKFFPEKTPKSIFRGMVKPAMERLNLARFEPQIIRLSPNGRFVLLEDNGTQERLRLCLRDHSVIEFGLYKGVFDVVGSELKKFDESIFERSSRFMRYLDHFGVALPPEALGQKKMIEELYKHNSVLIFLIEDRVRRELLAEALPSQKLVQIDAARWRLIKELSKRGYMASSYFVDEVLWKEWQDSMSTIDLWKGAKIDASKLIRRHIAYEVVLLRGT